MTALVHRSRVPRQRGRSLSRVAGYEWRLFLGAEAHLYLCEQLAPDVYWPAMLQPWCEENRPGSRRHERSAISGERLLSPRVAIRCVECGHLRRAANAEARSGQA